MAKRNQRADGRYQRMITLGRKPDGTYLRKTIYAKTQKELDDRVAEARHQINQGVFVSNTHVTFGEMAEVWYQHYKSGITQHTKYTYRQNLDKHLLPILGGFYLKELKPLHLQGIIHSLTEKGYASWTMKKVKQTAAQILNVAIENDLLHRNVFQQVKVPRIPPTERRALSEEEISLLTRTWHKHRMGLPTLIMLYCGLRKGEMLALKWDDIDFKQRQISVEKAVRFECNQPKVKNPKTQAGKRQVPIPDFLLEIFQAQKEKGIICPSAEGKIMSETAYRRAWQSYLHFLNLEAGGKDASRCRPKVQAIENITAHMLRHTYASMLYNAGVDVKSAQQFLGHASLEMTLAVYTHLSKYKENKSIEALNGYLNKTMKAEGDDD